MFWDEQTQNLDQAEQQMLNLYLERAELGQHQDILELGCGWGALTLYMAKHFPQSRITAVSNSNSQRAFIIQKADRLGLNNIEIITCDVNQLSMISIFDGVMINIFDVNRHKNQVIPKIHRTCA